MILDVSLLAVYCVIRGGHVRGGHSRYCPAWCLSRHKGARNLPLLAIFLSTLHIMMINVTNSSLQVIASATNRHNKIMTKGKI
jgi:hypothetical protein